MGLNFIDVLQDESVLMFPVFMLIPRKNYILVVCKHQKLLSKENEDTLNYSFNLAPT
jgi:hypothetical protein